MSDVEPLGRHSSGEAQREDIRTTGPHHPWHATITTTAIDVNRGRRTATPTDRVFEVSCHWTGPPAPYMPPSDRPVSAHDSYTVPELELARELHDWADEQLRQGVVPELRELARSIRVRRAITAK